MCVPFELHSKSWRINIVLACFSLFCLWCWLGFHGLAHGFGFFFPVLVYVVGLSVFLLSAMLSWNYRVGHGFVYEDSWVLLLVGDGFCFVFIVFPIVSHSLSMVCLYSLFYWSLCLSVAGPWGCLLVCIWCVPLCFLMGSLHYSIEFSFASYCGPLCF